MNIIDLNKAYSDCGGKAEGLCRLIDSGIVVPNGFVIQDSSNISNSSELEIEKKLLNFDNNTLFAVRSSANVEDGKNSSFAGIFETVLNVPNNIDEILKAISVVNNSVNSDVIKNYYEEKIKMNVVVQKMIDARMSGICFTNSIDYDGKQCAIIEFVNGLGEKLVSGKANSNKIIVVYENGALSSNNCRYNGALENFEGYKELILLIQKAINSLGDNLDIEWCIDKNSKPYLVQARPITKRVLNYEKTDGNSTNTVVASKGCVVGETHVIDSNLSYDDILKAIDDFPKGKILVTDYTETYFLPAMKKSIGIITNTGSSLCHAAIVARELEIPCIVGFNDATVKFKTGTKLKLDANNNIITTDNTIEKISDNFVLDFGNLDCFDNYFEIIIDGIKVFVEFLPVGVMIHKPDDFPTTRIDKLEEFVRNKFHLIPSYCSDQNKYLWIMEVERFKLLPRFEYYYNKIKRVSKNIDGNMLKSIQKALINYAKKIIDYKKACDNIEQIFFADEIIASINELLDGIIPFGYPLYESYMQSLQLVDEEGISFNDLFNSNQVIKSNKLKQIQKFLNVVSKIKDESYQIIWDMGGTNPDYFDTRDGKIKEYLKSINITNFDDVMNAFYSHCLDSNYAIINELIGDIDE